MNPILNIGHIGLQVSTIIYVGHTELEGMKSRVQMRPAIIKSIRLGGKQNGNPIGSCGSKQVPSTVKPSLTRLEGVAHAATVPSVALRNQGVQEIGGVPLVLVENPIQPSFYGLDVSHLEILVELHDYSVVGETVFTTKRAVLVGVHSDGKPTNGELRRYC